MRLVEPVDGRCNSPVRCLKQQSFSPFLAEQHVHYHQGGHALDDRHRPRHNTGIVAAFGLKNCRLSGKIDRRLGQGNGCRRFEGDAQGYRLAVADSSLDATGAVGKGAEPSVFLGEGVVMR